MLAARRCCFRAPAAGARGLAAAAATAQPVQFTPKAMTEELIRKIGASDEALRVAYDAVPAAFPAHSQPAGGEAAAVGHDAALRKRLLYRSKQRGWLEVDLLMGSWAAKHLADLSDAQLKEYERLLNRETIDIYNYITGKDTPPAELEGPVLESIRTFVASSPLGKASSVDYAAMKGVFSN